MRTNAVLVVAIPAKQASTPPIKNGKICVCVEKYWMDRLEEL